MLMMCRASVGAGVVVSGNSSELPVLNIYAVGYEDEDDMDYSQDELPDAENTDEAEVVQDTCGTSVRHDFPVYVEGLSECSNGASLLHREP